MSKKLIVAFLLGLAALASRADAAAPEPSNVTPELVAAAVKEGKVVFYTALDLQVASLVGNAFEKKYPGITAQVERNGSERVYQRVMQEYGSNIHAVDVLDSSDQVHLVDWKRRGMLVPYVPAELLKWPADRRDPDGYYAYNRATFSVIGINTKLLKHDDAPKSYADLLDPKWKGKLIKAHPAYAGYVMTATFILSRMFGWDYFQKLGQQRVMQLQSSNDPPKKLALGERPVMVDGNEYTTFLEIDKGAPLEVIYPTEGSPFVGGMSGVATNAPHPNAARLFINFYYSREAQQLLVDKGGLRSFHPDVKDVPSRVPVSKIKQLTADPVEMEKAIDEIKKKYAEYFGT